MFGKSDFDRRFVVVQVGNDRYSILCGTAGEGPYRFTNAGDAELVAHAPTDLRLALEVIKAAWLLVEAGQGQGLDRKRSLRAALERFEQAP